MNEKVELYHYVIIGAGIAGLSAIKTIRERDKTGSILLLSNENRLPYKRTKINKHIAAGFSTNDFALHSKQWYNDLAIDLIYEEVLSIDNTNNIITTNKLKYQYKKLLLSMGAKSSIPPISGLTNVPYHFVHYAHEVEKVIAQGLLKNHYLIIGGGIEALETADQLIKKDKKVTIIQRSRNPLRHMFPEAITKRIYDEIDKSGIEYFEEDEVKSVAKTDTNKILIKTLHHQFSVDEIIFCTGSEPNLSAVKDSNIKYRKGILVNEYLRTSDEDIFAAGDVAEHANGWVTGLWHPAEYQGSAAGKNMAGAYDAYKIVPYRLKSEFLNQFLFSANFHLVDHGQYDCITENKNRTYRELYSINNVVKAIAMINDKPRAKAYQKAIAEEWTISRVQKEIPLQ